MTKKELERFLKKEVKKLKYIDLYKYDYLWEEAYKTKIDDALKLWNEDLKKKGKK